MPELETKILRKEIARLHGQSDHKDEQIRIMLDLINWQNSVIIKQDLEIASLRRENDPNNQHMCCDPETCVHAKELQQKMPYYESPFNPSSVNSIPTMQAKADAHKKLDEYNKSGQKLGHKGVSQTDKSDEIVSYKDVACPICHDTDLTCDKSYQCRIRDMEKLPKLELKSYKGYKHKCNGCGHEWNTRKKILKIEGTEMGPNMLVNHGLYLFNNMTQGMIQKQLEFFDYRPSKATINNATFALANALKDEVLEIWKESESTEFVKFDETPIKTLDRQGYAWACVTDNSVLVRIADTRAARVLDQHFKPFTTKLRTVDGYPAYPQDKDTQRCWSHILIDSKHAIKTTMYPEETRTLHELLQKTYHIAKRRPPGDVSDLIAQVTNIADQHENLGNKFETKLRNAVSNLFTFVNHPGMAPTNNETELYMRPLAIHRNISLHFTTKRGMDAWSILFTFFFTCRKRGLSIKDELLRVITAKAAA